MDNQFTEHNTHLNNPQQFSEQDPHLSQLKTLPYTYKPTLLQNLPGDAGLFTLTGGCMTGKTTLIKQWMAALLAENVPPQQVIFYPCELIKNYHVLKRLLQHQLVNHQSGVMQYVFLDNVTNIPHWEKAVTFAAEAGWLNRVLLVLASRDRSIRKSEKHFHLSPLTFQQCVILKNQPIDEGVNLFAEFDQYLRHGGFLPAINDMASHGLILDSTLKHYADSLCGEILRHGRKKDFLRDILSAIIAHYSSQVTWNQLSQELTIEHPKTIGDYLALLESLDVVFVQYALLEESLKPAPKKARKLIYCDPFIYHAINTWLHPGKNYFDTQINATLADIEPSSKLVEASVTAHYRLYYPTYYIKAEGEIDLAYINDNRFWPLVVTWTNQLRAKDLKQILKYTNGKILTKAPRSGIIEHVRTEPIPRSLWKLGNLK